VGQLLKNNKKPGFTLIELLVVIAVVAVISAILFPVFATVRERSRRTVCQSNLKQIVLAMQQYVQDNNGTYPPSPYQWANAAYYYTKSVQVFRCPDHPANESFGDMLVLDPSSVSGSFHLDYTYDMQRLNTFNPPFPTKCIRGTQESMLATPSSIWLNMDASWSTDDGVDHDVRMVPKSSCGRSFPGSTMHSGAGNFSYADGHVKWLTPEDAAEVECLNGPLPAPFKD
jgi:prepilin-type N-terminal cleavage/methylation domain-containing protein/prepilin-type processing-associated H-X9-DG protein